MAKIKKKRDIKLQKNAWSGQRGRLYNRSLPKYAPEYKLRLKHKPGLQYMLDLEYRPLADNRITGIDLLVIAYGYCDERSRA
jgi:hypothetical protein